MAAGRGDNAARREPLDQFLRLDARFGDCKGRGALRGASRVGDAVDRQARDLCVRVFCVGVACVVCRGRNDVEDPLGACGGKGPGLDAAVDRGRALQELFLQ